MVYLGDDARCHLRRLARLRPLRTRVLVCCNHGTASAVRSSSSRWLEPGSGSTGHHRANCASPTMWAGTVMREMPRWQPTASLTARWSAGCLLKSRRADCSATLEARLASVSTGHRRGCSAGCGCRCKARCRRRSACGWTAWSGELLKDNGGLRRPRNRVGGSRFTRSGGGWRT